MTVGSIVMLDVMKRNDLTRNLKKTINQGGLTLIELMISMTLGLFILAGVLQMYVTSSQNSRVNDGVLRIQENIRYAMSRLEEDISQAGNLGCFSVIHDQRESETSFSDVSENPKNFILNILSNQMDENDWDRAISATNGATNTPDSLTLRYLSSLGQIPIAGVNKHKQHFTVKINNNHIYASNFSRLKPFDIVVAASCSGAMVFMITNDPVKDGYVAFKPGIPSKQGQKNKPLSVDDSFFEKIVGREGEPPGAIYTYPSGSYIYSIGRAASAKGSCSTDNPQHCALMLNDRELVEGVQNFQVEFGRQFGDSAHPQLQFVAADSDSLTEDHLGWGAVDRIKVTMTFSSIDPIPTNQGSRLITKTVTNTFAVANQLIGPE